MQPSFRLWNKLDFEHAPIFEILGVVRYVGSKRMFVDLGQTIDLSTRSHRLYGDVSDFAAKRLYRTAQGFNPG